MKKVFYIFIISLMKIYIVAQAKEDMTIRVPEKERVLTSYEDIIFDVNIIKTTKESALSGNSSDASALFCHYSEFVFLETKDWPENLTKDELLEQCEYWTMITIENCFFEKTYRNIRFFIDFEKNEPEIRKKYWIYRSLFLEEAEGTKQLTEKEKKNIELFFTENVKYIKKNLKKEEIALYEKGALCGNKNAAYSLGNYYKKNKNSKKELYWYRIGAQNGSKECMKKYAELLSKSKDKYDNIRAEFWKQKSEEKD